MNNPLDPSLKHLSDCGCCAGTETSTPETIENRPGLSAVYFRSGTHARFKASLLAALTSKERPALAKLTTRADEDFTVALLDGFSAMADVLTFYSERIANESFLRTATERRSVLELARTIGYELRPGVAASTWLAFTIEQAQGAPGYATIDPRTKVQSVPGPGEKPQTFETVETLEAKKEWNELKPLSRDFITPYLGQTEIYLQGVATNLKPGDALLIVGDERLENVGSEQWDFRRVKAIKTVPDSDAAKAYTVVTLHQPLGSVHPFMHPAKKNPKAYALRIRANLFGHGAPEWRALGKDVRAAFGKPDPANGQPSPADWDEFTIHAVTGHDPSKTDAAIALDAVYPTIAVRSWVVLAAKVGQAYYQEAYRVTSVTERAPHKFTLTQKVTQLGIEEGRVPENLKEKFDGKLRDTSVFAQSELLPWAAAPILRTLQGRFIELDQAVPDLAAKRRLIVQGRRMRASVSAEKLTLTLPDNTQKEIVKGDEAIVLMGPADWSKRKEAQRWDLMLLDGVSGVVIAAPANFEMLPAKADDPSLVEFTTLKASTTPIGARTTLELFDPLKHAYDPATVSIFANVALATHGETVQNEVLGHGDAARAHQKFILKQAPLTFTSAPTPSGAETSLEVWVNDVKWKEVASLYALGQRERVFVARRADDGTTQIIFGDGKFGARLPTGRENIRATYRKGIGFSGLMDPGQLSLLITRPLGVKSVKNPAPATGAQDPEELAQARQNAPMQVLTFGRVVSLQDYQDFARTFSGMAKAHATWTWTAKGRGVFVTVAAPGGEVLLEGSEAVKDLKAALINFGNPNAPVEVKVGAITKFSLAGTIFVSADYAPEKVKAALDSALKERFNFDVMDFGRGIALSEVFAIIQNVPGVVSCDLDQFRYSKRAALKDPLNPMLPALQPVPGMALNSAKPAELLVLDEASLANLKVKVP